MDEMQGQVGNEQMGYEGQNYGYEQGFGYGMPQGFQNTSGEYFSEELDRIFKKEFDKTMSQRRGITGQFNIQNVPIPQEAQTDIVKKNSVYLWGIPEELEYFNELNTTEALKVGRASLKKRTIDRNGHYKKDENGRDVTIDVDVPNGCIAVLSEKWIQVPETYNVKKKGDFYYVDVLHREYRGKDKKLYIYIVPKRYCYDVNKVALVISKDKKTNLYGGYKINLQNGFPVYLEIVPYKPEASNNAATKVICVKNSTDFNKEIQLVLKFWETKGIIFHIADMYVEGCDCQNLVVRELVANLDDYIPVNREKSLADMKVTGDDFFTEEVQEIK